MQQDEFRVAHWGWWVSIMGGMALTAWIAFVPAGYELWCSLATDTLSQGVFAWIFWLAVVAHVFEASYAFRVASALGSSHTWRWTLQTLMLGYPSIQQLKQG